jgi:hypothetical protein
MSKVRVQLDLTTRESVALDNIRDECQLRSRADAVKAALAVLAWVQSETQHGRKVVSLDGKNVSWLVMPGVTDIRAADTSPKTRVRGG